MLSLFEPTLVGLGLFTKHPLCHTAGHKPQAVFEASQKSRGIYFLENIYHTETNFECLELFACLNLIMRHHFHLLTHYRTHGHKYLNPNLATLSCGPAVISQPA